MTGIPVSIVWFAAFAALATWVLLRTRMGNWIFAAGGDPNAARNSGVPVDRVKTGLFMLTACAAALVALLTVLEPDRRMRGAGSRRNSRRSSPP